MNKCIVERIGNIFLGCDGADEYFLVSRLDDDIDIDELHYDATQRYRYDSGLNFCNQVSVVMCEHSTNKAIITVHHQID